MQGIQKLNEKKKKLKHASWEVYDEVVLLNLCRPKKKPSIFRANTLLINLILHKQLRYGALIKAA